ncbi:hypothetical protein [Streptomyces sp. NPDC050504]|uniref:hypothetical protein n=1 Tax=Streptomyces sp. NPDC050504 TaxID=3365618 RepID=UPI0037878F26
MSMSALIVRLLTNRRRVLLPVAVILCALGVVVVAAAWLGRRVGDALGPLITVMLLTTVDPSFPPESL